jgi:hypothetical protein
MKLSLPPNLVEKLVCFPDISFCKISFLVMYLTSTLLGRNWPFLTPSHLTLQITLIYQHVLMTMIEPSCIQNNPKQIVICSV